MGDFPQRHQIQLVEKRNNETYLDTWASLIAEARPDLAPGVARHRAVDVTVLQNGLWLNWAIYADRADLERGLDQCDRIALSPVDAPASVAP